MKYGIYFLLLAALMLSITIQFGGWYLIMIYPALSFAIVSIGYAPEILKEVVEATKLKAQKHLLKLKEERVTFGTRHVALEQ